MNARIRVVSGVVGEPAVAHAVDLRVRRQARGELESVSLGALDAQRQRADAAQREVGLERAGSRAVQVAVVVERLGGRGIRGDDDAEQQIGMTAEVLGRAMDRPCRAVLERPQEHRARERGVDGDRDPGAARARREFRYVGERHQRVLRGLDPQEVGAGERVSDRSGVGEIDPHVPPASILLGLLEHLAKHFHVHRPRRDKVPASPAPEPEPRRAAASPEESATASPPSRPPTAGPPARPSCAARRAHISCRSDLSVQGGHEGDWLVEQRPGPALGAPGGDHRRSRGDAVSRT